MNEKSIIEANDELNTNEINRQEEYVNAVDEISKDQNDTPCIGKIDESEMTFPIISEERSIKQKQRVVNGISYFEKKKAIEIHDGKNTVFTTVKLNRKIGNKIYKYVEIFKDEKSKGKLFNLDKGKKEQFEDEWGANWNPSGLNNQTLKNEFEPNSENVISDFAPADNTPVISFTHYTDLSDMLQFEGLRAKWFYRLVLANAVKLTKDAQGWSTIVQNEENQVIIKGELETFSHGFLLRNGGIKYNFFVKSELEKYVPENILKLESGVYLPKDIQSNKDGWIENQMVVSKYDGTNTFIKIGTIVTNRCGYDIFDMKNGKMFEIKRTSRFLNCSPKSTYSVHRLPLRDDKGKANNATIEVEKAHSSIPATSTLIDYKSPTNLSRNIDEMGLLLAILFQTLQKPMLKNVLPTSYD